ncbi:MAG: PA14 domain-containing protein [Caldilineaceae bacterium]
MLIPSSCHRTKSAYGLHRLWKSVSLLVVMLLNYVAPLPLWAQTATPSATPVVIEVYLPVVSDVETRTTVAVTGQAIGPVVELLGQLHPATGHTFGNFLLTYDNIAYGLTGSTQSLEQQIDALREQQPPIAVKVWGTLYHIANEVELTLIVVSSIEPVNRNATTTTPSAPVAQVTYALVNLYAGPASAYTRTGQVTRGQSCTIIGRNRLNTWVELRCTDGLNGWIDQQLVRIQGDVNSVPITEPQVTVVGTPTPTATATSLPIPTLTPTPAPILAWRAEFFPNWNLQGTPTVIRDYSNLDFNWGSGAPAAELPVDGFSARFERILSFTDGYYRFSVTADDGVRFWLDGELILDEWHGATGRTYTVERDLNGVHTLRIEYYEANGLAQFRFTTDYITAAPDWTAEYFANTDLLGTPVFTQAEARATIPLDHDWQTASPFPARIPADNWSARWTGRFRFDYGAYVFRATADDGVRVWLNNQLVLDSWHDGYSDVTNRFYGVGADTHTIRIEYYERTGNASLRVWWYKDTSGGPQ